MVDLGGRGWLGTGRLWATRESGANGPGRVVAWGGTLMGFSVGETGLWIAGNIRYVYFDNIHFEALEEWM